MYSVIHYLLHNSSLVSSPINHYYQSYMFTGMRSTAQDSDDYVLKIGIVGDTQYVDSDNGHTFDGKTVRRYRQSLKILGRAIDYFEANNVNIRVIVGDLLDSKANDMKIVPACLNDFLKVINLMKDADDSMSSPKDANIIKWLMCVGNHDLVAMSRRSFFDSFLSNLSTDPSATFAPSDADGNAATLSPRPPLYFDYVCHHPTRAKHSVRLIFLDGYEISVCGAISDKMQEEACAILTAKNKNLSTVPQGNWFAGLADEDLRYVPYNGAPSPAQLQWLRERLLLSHREQTRCVVFAHMPLYRQAARPMGLMWGAEKVLEMFHSEDVKGCVIAVVAGHDHDGGYAVDDKGIHHIVLPAPLECEVGQDAFGFLSIRLGDSSSSSSSSNTTKVDQVDSQSTQYFELSWQGRLPVNHHAVWPRKMACPNRF